MLREFKGAGKLKDVAKKAKGTWGGARQNPGPKPKPPSETRRNRIMLNLTDEEHRNLVRVAGGPDKAARYVRHLLARHLRRNKS